MATSPDPGKVLMMTLPELVELYETQEAHFRADIEYLVSQVFWWLRPPLSAAALPGDQSDAPRCVPTVAADDGVRPVTDAEARRLAEDRQLGIESDSAAQLVCRTLLDTLRSKGGKLPWPGLQRPFDEWADDRRGHYSDGHAQAVCRAIAAHIAKGGRAPKGTGDEYNRWAGIQRQITRELHELSPGAGKVKTTRAALMDSPGVRAAVRARADGPDRSYFVLRFGDLELAFEPQPGGPLLVALYQRVGVREPVPVDGLEKIPVLWLDEDRAATALTAFIAGKIAGLLKTDLGIDAEPEHTAVTEVVEPAFEEDKVKRPKALCLMIDADPDDESLDWWCSLPAGHGGDHETWSHGERIHKWSR